MPCGRHLPAQRAESDRWTDWTASTFQPAWLDVFWRYYRTAPEKRDAAVIAAGIAKTEACFAILDARLSTSPFLGGEQLTYGDIAAGVAMFRWTTMGIERKSHAAVESWMARLQDRTGYRDTVELDYSELAGRSVA